MAGTKYDIVQDGEWVKPKMKDYKLMCCDCGLVHDIDFKITHIGKKHSLEFRPKRNKRSTGQARRNRK